MKWSKEKAWEWYNARPWLRGCNFMSSDCCNRIDQWQEYDFDKRLETTDKELELLKKTGFNSIRIILEFIVWKKEHDGFMERFEKYLETADKHGITCMVVFGNDCMPPKEELMARMQLGEQHVDWGYHGGRKISQHGQFEGCGYSLLDDPELAEEHYEWVREIVTKYKNDERIVMWDIFNEPGNSKRGNLSFPHMKKFFEIIREINPVQPITTAIWSVINSIDKLPEIEKWALDNSDIVSYHNYSPYADNIQIIAELKKLGRPIINSEWLARPVHNTIEEMFPLFYLEKIGCYNWGFVAGKYQTYEPYNGTWDVYKNNPSMDFDFTKWYHDLYRPSLNPYNPRETELIKRFADLADNEYGIK